MSPLAGNLPIAVRDLTKRYGQTLAIDHISFSLHHGQILALLGPNGAGKTSTVEICEGYRTYDGGTVRVFGLDPVKDSSALRPLLGVMPQHGGAYQQVRAEELLGLLASFAAHPLDAKQLLNSLGLADVAQISYKRLSGGQQQRLSLAMAVISRPELVFLDEPTAGLDPQSRRATWELIDALRRDGVSVLLTTHHIDEAEQLADYVVVIDHGRIVASGTPDELTRGGGDTQLRFHTRTDLPLQELQAALPPQCYVSSPSPGNYLIDGPVDPHLLAKVTAWCAERGILTHDLCVARRTLEDVFLELTGRELRS